MAAPVNRTVNIYINQAQAELSVERLQKKFDSLTKAIEKGEAAGKDMSKQVDSLKDVGKRLEEIKNVMDGKFAPSIKLMRSHVRDLRKELEGMSSDAEGYEEKLDVFHKADASLQQMESSLRRVNNTVSRGAQFWTQFKAVALGTLIGNTVQAATDKLLGYFSGMLTGNAKLSDSLADVKKSTGLTAAQVEVLNEKISKINTRDAASQLREIAIGLGQIGEAATAENIANIDKIVVALGDEFGGGANEITKSLGVLRNNLHDIKTGNYGEDVLHIGNALNVLGAEGLATAPVVTDIATRIAGVAQTFGVSSGQIFGFAATMQELGIETEKGSTAFIKVLQKMTQNVDAYAKVAEFAGISQKDFVDLVNTDIVAAFQKVAEGAKIAGANNVAFGKVLKDLDADGSGAGEIVSKLASNSELFAEKTKLATDALKDSSSITDEFNTKNNNLAATLEKIEKHMAGAFTNSEVKNSLADLATWFGEIIGAVSKIDEATYALHLQNEVVNQLEKDMVPAIEQYDALTAKADSLGGITHLSVEEQAALRKAINGVANAAPYAISQIDDYGNAMDVNTDKAKEYLRIQKLVLAERNRDAIKTSENEVKNLEKTLRNYEARIADFERVKQFHLSKGWTYFVEDDVQQINNYNRLLLETQNRLYGVQGILNELKTGSALGDSNHFPLAFKVPNFKDQLLKNGKGTVDNTVAPSSDYQTDDDRKAAEREAKQLEKQKQNLEKQHEQTLRQMEDLHRKMLAKNDDVQAILKNKDDEEVANAHTKYEKLENELKEYAEEYQTLYKKHLDITAELAGLNETEQLELQALYHEQFKRRSDEEYKLSLQGVEDYYNQEKQKAGQDYLQKLISKREYTARIKKLESDEANARALVAEDYKDTSEKAAKDTEDLKTKAVQKGIADRERLEKQETDNRIAGYELAVVLAKKGSRAELDAKKALLKQKFAEETEGLDKSSEIYKLKSAQLNTELANLDTDFYAAKIEKVREVADQMLGIWQQYNQTLNQRDQARLNKEKKAIDDKKKALDEQLKAGVISQAAYNNKVQKLDDDYAKKEDDAKRREFNRNKLTTMAQIATNFALGTANIWAHWAAFPPAAAALNVIALGVQAAQLGIVAASKYPAYEKGGRLPGVMDGASHTEGGISMIDSKTGRKIGEAQGGEPILSIETYANNKALVDQLLYSSMYGGGKAIDTGWLYRSPQGINTDAYQSSVNTQFVTTASFRNQPAYTSTDTGGADPEMKKIMTRLSEVLENPPPAQLVWRNFTKMQDMYEKLQNESRLNKNR